MEFKSFFNKLKQQVVASSDALMEKFESGESVDENGVPLPPKLPPTPPTSASDGTGPVQSSHRGVLPGMSKRGQQEQFGLVQNEKDDSVYQQRSEHIDRIESMFGEFGPNVCSYMLTQSMIDGGIGRILRKINLTTRGRDGADMAQIENWILRNGVEAFQKTVGLRTSSVPLPPPAPPEMAETQKLKPAPKLVVRPLDPKQISGAPQGQRPVASPPTPAYQRPSNIPRTPNPATRDSQDSSTNGTPTPVGALPVTSPTHLQKVTVTPLGLKGMDIQRTQNRPAPVENVSTSEALRFPPSPPPASAPAPQVDSSTENQHNDAKSFLDKFVDESTRM